MKTIFPANCAQDAQHRDRSVDAVRRLTGMVRALGRPLLAAVLAAGVAMPLQRQPGSAQEAAAPGPGPRSVRVAADIPQKAYLKASNAGALNFFGFQVATAGDTIVVGAYGEAGSITSTVESPNNNAPYSGAAYVFTRSVDGTWTQAAYLKASNAETFDYFGASVAIDGDTIVVGAFNEKGSITSTVESPNDLASGAGAVYVFTRSVDGTWTQAAYLKASNAGQSDGFGSSVAISGDTIVVGAQAEDGSITSTVGSPNNFAGESGAAYVFTRSVDGTWTQAAYLKASNADGSDFFGESVAIAGDTIVASVAYEDGSITSTVESPNNFASNAGAAHVFTRSVDGTWTQAAYLKASNTEVNDSFGSSVAIAGDTIVVGAKNEDGSITSTVGSPNNFASNAGAAYVFTRSVAGAWTQAAYLKASNADTIAAFGVVAISGDTIMVGASMEFGSITSTVESPNNLAPGAGAAYMFTRSVDGAWTQAAYLKASNAEASDLFGGAMAIAGDTIAVGAKYEAGSITSTVESPNNAAAQAGAAYVFRMLSTDASLSGLALSDGVLTPAFVSTTTSYAASVENAVSSVIITPTVNDAGATYTVATSSGACASNACALNVGANAITVTVTAAAGNTAHYVVLVTRAAAPTATPTATPTQSPGGPTPTPTPPPATFAPYVSPSYGAVTTSTVSIIGPAGSGFTGATGVFVKGVKMFHVVRSDKKIDFTMKQSVAVAGTTVDVVLVKAGGEVVTITQAYTFTGPTSAVGSTSSGAVLTTTSGVTVTVPPQTAARSDAALVGGSLVITYAPSGVLTPPGDVPLSFFDVAMSIDDSPVTTVTNALTMELPVDPALVPAGQQPWLFELTSHSSPLTSSADGGRWLVVPNQTYDPATGLVTAPTNRLGTYALVTAAMRWVYVPYVTTDAPRR